MNRERTIVAVGMVCGLVAMLAGVWFLSGVLPAPGDMATAGYRLGYALRWNAVAALPLLLMTGSIANRRFFSPAIDPTRGAEDRVLQVNCRVAENTVQQLAIFCAGTLALAATLAPGDLPLLAASAIVFALARIVFWIGYRIDPPYRAPGFVASAWLGGGLLVWACWNLFVSFG